ncbi:TetR family transcriptional regulator [Cellulomonas humilata]|uniref:TetR family transcriptional regulator n=1 Tax=Cellulomonas humilata TaxID=144055 RepID=A0A7Y6A145_9CELL|nr:TetR family transcriptional regulator C-terminal domain-containing protein [Cellulomonas humilata]NUU17834.1 TetR family transcriptional regulator [Cellulomonas humilata]
MTSPRSRALDAAIDLLGTKGLRALTHVRVDDRAGIPRGSTSNYFRTRAALLAGVAGRIIEREMPAAATALAPTSVDEVVDSISALVVSTTTVQRTLTTARLVLFMEASHDPTLRDALAAGRQALEGEVVSVLARLGSPDPATGAAAVMACAEGLILHRIARGDETDPRRALELVTRAALA